MEFQIVGKITSADDAEMFNALLWLKDNYGTKIHNAQATGSTKEIRFNFIESTFNDTVASIISLKAQFNERLIDYDFIMAQ